MFPNTLSRRLAKDVISAFMPTAQRWYSRPASCKSGRQPPANFFQYHNAARAPFKSEAATEKESTKHLMMGKQGSAPRSAWELPPECCKRTCPDLLPRFDTLYYKMTDKGKREYQQTWVECPPQPTRPRKVCCYESTELPPIYPRVQPVCTTTAREFDSRGRLKGATSKCPHLQTPCCLRGRYPPTCRISKPNSNCKKIRCPYPSYAECMRPCRAPAKPKECFCAIVPAICDVVRYLKRKLQYDLPPPLPAWPT